MYSVMMFSVARRSDTDYPDMGAPCGGSPTGGESMDFAPAPATAAWQHRDARAGFEVVYFQPVGEGCRIEGWTTAIEGSRTWAVEYIIDLDGTGATRSARIRGRSAAGFSSTLLEADGAGRWLVDGVPASHLDDCLDVDLESSAMTNALPVRRMSLAPGAHAAAPAAYVRSIGLAVERLEQTYLRAPDEAARQRYDYTAPAFDFACRLIYDESGLVLDYPGIAVRAG
jgi:hypothetical protein